MFDDSFKTMAVELTHAKGSVKEVADDELAKDNEIKSEGVGIAGARTTQWDRFEKL
ncbi:hypothetical protein ADIARSV_2334 [Arcticibacter svalbardensis MN12-7]|uniref:Uncharacterized protein n=2 Tax=Arcticibacter TaxID=1288026 RepID=R9GS11_9SPHI|nr:hypothetical protein ADIARSV_2334 [Arcticibacter svalbardensis MN12-7]